MPKHTIELDYQVGDLVHDDLTDKVCKVIGLQYTNGQYSNGQFTAEISYMNAVGYRIDSPHLQGYRHPWELSYAHY